MFLSAVRVVCAMVGAVNPPDSAADAVTMADGTVLLGQVLEPVPGGGLLMLVRRDWARARAPAWLRRWERAEAPLVLRARRERKERLAVWRQDRAGANGAAGDPLTAWIDREIPRLSTLRPPRIVLTAAALSRHEVRQVVRRDEPTARLLRLGWLAGLGGVETMSVRDLRDALAFRGRLRPDAPVSVDALLPLYPESEDRWRTRRAATEAAAEPDLRFVLFRQFVLPEIMPGGDAAPATTTELIDSPAGRLAFGSIQAVTPFDAVQERLDDFADQGRTGAVVTRLEFNVDSDRAEAESTFYVRLSGGDWSPVYRRNATARTDELDGAAGPVPGPDASPVRTTLLVLESVASSPSSPKVSGRRQAIGAAARLALARARAALDLDLAPFVLPVAPGAR
jgi:hypothetical protein